jgi:tetratricopeptide (TPR) repeat protein
LGKDVTSRTLSVRVLPLVLALATLAPACGANDADKHRYLESGNRFAAQQRYAEAIVEFRNALRIDDKFGEAREELGDALSAAGSPEGALREYVRAADLMPANLDVQKKAATFLLVAGQFEDVRARAQAVLRTNANDVDAHLLHANALVGMKDLDGALRLVEEAVQLDPRHARAFTNLALLQMAQGDRNAAEAAFNKAAELDPTSQRAHLALAEFNLATGNIASAEKSLRAALDINPDDPLTNRALATLFAGTGRAELAERPLQVVADVTRTPRAKLALAEYYAGVNKADRARAILEPMAKDATTLSDAQIRLAQLAFSEGRTAEANKMLDQVLAREPNHSLALQVKARWLLLDHQPLQALERATAAVSASPTDVRALYLRGILEALNQQPEQAIKSFSELLRLNPRATAARVQLAQLRLTRGETDTAVGQAAEAVLNSPGVPEARLVLARALVARRDFARADVEVGRLLAAAPGAPAVLAIKGTLQMLRGDAAGARSAYQAAYDADPGSIAALTGLTVLDSREKRLTESRRRLEARLQVQPNRSVLYTLAAKVYIGLSDLAAAEKVLRRAVELSPLDPEPFALLGALYRAQNRMNAALAEFDGIVAKDGGNVPARTMGAMLVHASQRMGEAKRRYEEVLALEPRAAAAANNLAWIYADERQNLDRAVQLAQDAAEQTGLPEVWDTLGWVYYRKQLPNRAVESFEKAVAQSPENATFQHHLGLALAGSGDRARARTAFETALKLQPGFSEARQQLAALSQ